jgi:protein-L-isoaspartate O-methyltransferase
MVELDMNLEQARFNMIEQQIRTWDVLNLDVLQTLVDVRREAFVPVACRSLAFMDTEIPLPNGQHMLSPKLEARLLQELAPTKDESVLEIGTGSGYMAALLAHHAQHVTTVEIDAACYALATKNSVTMAFIILVLHVVMAHAAGLRKRRLMMPFYCRAQCLWCRMKSCIN